VDKTGTLTMNSMTVRELVVDGQTWPLGDEPLPERFHEIAAFAVLASPVDPFDPMDKAFKAIGERYLTDVGGLPEGWQLVKEYPLDEDLLALSHVWRSPAGDEYVVAAKGAPEAVADLCHLDATELAAVEAQVDAATAGGRRVLGVARASIAVDEGLPPEQHDFDFTWLGLAALQDPVRPGVAQAVAECAGAGVRTVMITGDYPGTALAIAREIGLRHEAGVITGPELADLSDDDLARRIRDVSIFARMVPEQKLRLIRALKTDGEVVGMTGDGVNDAPALRASDIGIAMGKRGTDVAREAADLVITDDDFTSIAGGVRQGRGIFDNLRKAMAYILAVHIPIVGMSLVPVFVADWPLVLLPLQIAFLELIIDPACSVVFEAEEIDSNVMRQPPRRVGEPIFGRRVLLIATLQGLSVFATVLGVYLSSVLSDRPDPTTRSLTFATLVIGNLALILVNRSWRLSVWRTFRERRNPTLRWILPVAAAVLVAMISVPGVRRTFDLGPMAAGDWVVAVVAGCVGLLWFEVYKSVGHPRAGGTRPRDRSAAS
jgi:Ca2+-transporting ATPase